jgi:hypothetical protein
VDHVIHRAGRAGEVEDIIYFADVEGLANVFVYKLESRIISEMVKIGEAPGEQVIDDNHVPAFTKQGITEMRS